MTYFTSKYFLTNASRSNHCDEHSESILSALLNLVCSVSTFAFQYNCSVSNETDNFVAFYQNIF